MREDPQEGSGVICAVWRLTEPNLMEPRVSSNGPIQAPRRVRDVECALVACANMN
ncbi:hypothetical protein AWB66_05497 [Caballeronia telluris]|uniref:Uncharacterized protein n=1 Tax=Caballeronia telluris TaxID=326475 RepID=A0A158K788_9BURK|nr:hypothetical protein AWB66_05497 [Caballeronia telluris]